MMQKTLNYNKSDLVNNMLKEFPDLGREVIVDSIECILQEIITSTALDKRVEIRGFGVFSKKYIRPRQFTNPKTKEVSYLGETATMHFKASSKFLHLND